MTLRTDPDKRLLSDKNWSEVPKNNLDALLVSNGTVRRDNQKLIIPIARFPSLRSWVYTEVKGCTMSDMVNDQQFEELLSGAETALRSYVNSDGTVSFPMPAHIVAATKI